eukprot:2413338-Pyramimonas_sp.AAC.1
MFRGEPLSVFVQVLRLPRMFPQEVVIGPMPEPPGAFVEGLERELGTYHGVLDQSEYFGRVEEPAYIRVSAVRTSGGRYPVRGPDSRGWR